MLDQPSDTPTSPPPRSVLLALDGGGRFSAAEVDTSGTGIPAQPNGTGGYHVGRGTLVRVNGNPPITWESFVDAHTHLDKRQLRAIFADLSARGASFGDLVALEVTVVAEAAVQAVSLERLSADARLARLDAAYLHLREARRRYFADTACNAWSLEQALRDVTLAAMKASEAMAVRSEAA